VGTKGCACRDHSTARDARHGGSGRRRIEYRRACKDLRRNEAGLLCVVAAHATGHEEGLDKAQDRRYARPAEQQVQHARDIPAQVEVVDAEAAEKERQQHADDLIAARLLVFSKEPGPLVRGHGSGINRIVDRHREKSSIAAKINFLATVSRYEERRQSVPSQTQALRPVDVSPSGGCWRSYTCCLHGLRHIRS